MEDRTGRRTVSPWNRKETRTVVIVCLFVASIGLISGLEPLLGSPIFISVFESNNGSLAPQVIRTLVNQHIEYKIQERLAISEDYQKQFHARFNISTILQNRCHRCINAERNAGRLGNFMFSVASSLGIALKNNYTPVFLDTDYRQEYFQGPFLEIPDKPFQAHITNEPYIPFKYVVEKGAAIHNSDTLNLTASFGNASITLGGYLQSWKYFHNNSAEVRAMLTFKKSILEQAKDYIDDRLIEIMYTGGLANFTGLPMLVGVHVRRGDLTTEDAKRSGYRVPPDGYILRAVGQFERDYSDNIIFVVASDDIRYCKNFFHLLKKTKVTFLEYNKPELDLAILSLMDNMIITTGTFGWWGAYLSGAKRVFYYKPAPRKGSRIGNETNVEDYFLPNWTGRI